LYWLMLILNSQSKTICNSTNLNLAWPELAQLSPSLFLLFVQNVENQGKSTTCPLGLLDRF
jgi:hypothetical protein